MGEHTSAATRLHSTEHYVCRSIADRALDEIALHTVRGEESALRLRSSENSTVTTAPVRRSAQKQQELIKGAYALDPIRLIQQVEQLQQAIFRCTIGCSPFITSLATVPIRVFSIARSMIGKLPVEESVANPTTGLQTLYREQERRKRVLGWRCIHKDPFEGEWEQVFSWLEVNPEPSGGDIFPRVAAPLTWSLSAITNLYADPAACGKSEPTCWKLLRSNGKLK